MNPSSNKNIAHRVLEKLNKDKYFKENVHDRLYTEAKQRMIRKNQVNNMLVDKNSTFTQQQFYSDNLLSNEISNLNSSYKVDNGLNSEEGQRATNRLYYGGIRNLQIRENEINEAKMFLTKLEDQDLTFNPKINKISNMITSAKPRPRSVENRLIQYGKTKMERHHLLQAVKYENEISDCTFNPTIDPISNQIVNERSRVYDDIPRHEYLFGLSKVHNDRLKTFEIAMSQKYPFKPQVNPYSYADNYNSQV